MSALCGVLMALAWLVWPSRRLRDVRSLAQESLGDRPADARAGHRSPGPPAAPDATVADVAQAMDLLALSMRSGIGLVEAVDTVAAEVGGPLGRQLAMVTAALRWGVDDASAWATAPAVWQPTAGALLLAARAGVPPADLLLRAAEDLRRAERQRLEVATARLGVLIVLPLGVAFLPAFVLTTVVPVVVALAHDVLGQR